MITKKRLIICMKLRMIDFNDKMITTQLFIYAPLLFHFIFVSPIFSTKK